MTRTVKGNRRVAERELTKLLRDLDAGTLADAHQPLERYLSSEWLPAVSKVSYRGRALAPTTRQRYGDAVRHASAIIGKIHLVDLRPAHIEKVRDGLLSQDSDRRPSQGIFACSRRHFLAPRLED